MRQELEMGSILHHAPGLAVLPGLQVAVEKEIRRMGFEKNVPGEM
jgi:hypothetical protein